MSKNKPTIHELEKILGDTDEPRVKIMPDGSVVAIDDEIAKARSDALEEAAKIADDYKKREKPKGKPLLGREILAEIDAEERGQDIAAERIALVIRAAKKQE